LRAVDAAIAKAQLAAVRCPHLFGRDEQAQIVTRLQVEAQRPMLAFGGQFGVGLAQRAGHPGGLRGLIRLDQLESNAEIGVAGDVQLIDPHLPLLHEAEGGLRRQRQKRRRRPQLAHPLQRRRGRGVLVAVAPRADGGIDHRRHKVFGQVIGRSGVGGLVEIVGAADGRHRLDQRLEAAAQAVIQQRGAPDGV
jgi:hypothetical protein